MKICQVPSQFVYIFHYTYNISLQFQSSDHLVFVDAIALLLSIFNFHTKMSSRTDIIIIFVCKCWLSNNRNLLDLFFPSILLITQNQMQTCIMYVYVYMECKRDFHQRLIHGYLIFIHGIREFNALYTHGKSTLCLFSHSNNNSPMCYSHWLFIVFAVRNACYICVFFSFLSLVFTTFHLLLYISYP